MDNTNHQKYLLEKLQGKTVVLLSQTGSRLYGLENQHSDWDWYAVTLEDTRAHQKVVGDEDVTVMPFDRFLGLVAKGAPQALEVLWNPEAYRDPRYAPMLSALRPNLWLSRYRHLAEQGGCSFSKERYSDEEVAYRKRKHNRHRVRLALQWLQMAEHGYYTPRLEGESLEKVLRAGDSEDYSLGFHDGVESRFL